MNLSVGCGQDGERPCSRPHPFRLEVPSVVREERIAALLLMGLAAFYLVAGWELPIWSQYAAMGPGLLPHILGIALAAVALLIWLLARPIEFTQEEEMVWRSAWRRRLSFVGLLAMYPLAGIPLLGFTASNSLLVLGMRRLYEPSSWKADLLGAMGVAALVHLVFVTGMGLQFPVRPAWM